MCLLLIFALTKSIQISTQPDSLPSRAVGQPLGVRGLPAGDSNLAYNPSAGPTLRAIKYPRLRVTLPALGLPLPAHVGDPERVRHGPYREPPVLARGYRY